ncbi:MAG: membrane protein [Fimbriimonadales bacterium]|nr:MAG: membrane protein [Fimbriimonadales bacterium]GIV09062.1 MAG: membrane protein [Fimbriimonadales bacterium]
MAHAETTPKLYGIMAEFETPDQLLEAARRTREAGYRKFDCYTPFPIHGLTAAMGVKEAKVPWTVFTMGLLGAIGAFSLQAWTNLVDYPLNVAGRDLLSWPYFIPITFEGMVLAAAFGAFFGTHIYNRMLTYYHPVFNVPQFARASSDRFFVCIESQDPNFDRNKVYEFLQSLNPISIAEVPE